MVDSEDVEEEEDVVVMVKDEDAVDVVAEEAEDVERKATRRNGSL